jgi:hypothetical protein
MAILSFIAVSISLQEYARIVASQATTTSPHVFTDRSTSCHPTNRRCIMQRGQRMLNNTGRLDFGLVGSEGFLLWCVTLWIIGFWTLYAWVLKGSCCGI